MKLDTFRYQNGAWSRTFPDLDSERTMVLAFAAPSFASQPRLMMELAMAYPRAAMIGCSTAGEIDQTQIRDQSMVVAVVQFERTRVRQAEARIESEADSYAAGARLAAELLSPELRAVIVLAPGTGVNGRALVSGLSGRLPARVVVSGGLAADGPRFGPTWVVASGRIEPRAAVAVGVYGEHVRVSRGAGGGWRAAGAAGGECVVTRASGNVVHELDHRPALARYRQLLGDRAAELPRNLPLFPLSIRATPEDDRRVMRTVIGVDEAAQSLMLAAQVVAGAYAQVMHGELEELVQAAQAAGAAASGRFDGPVLCVTISCVGRRMALRARGEHEIQATLEGLPVGTAQVGFYAYGEIAQDRAGQCDLENEMVALTVVGEST
ncbi:MAG TPA: FIST N-terminal domain-containing protein [Kofleriaceae bacterium]|nr:FIST N-terminal domain-containing protein [Kofleriaceae bacterium]